MDTSELLNKYRSIRLLQLKHGRWDKEEVSEAEEKIREFIMHLEHYLFQHDWQTGKKGEQSRTYVNKGDPDKYLEIEYHITYPDRRTFYRVELKLKGKRFLFDKVLAEGEMVFSKI